MTIELRHPRPQEEPALRELFTEAFADAAFTGLFFQTGFSPERCIAAFDGGLLAALHWFDCSLDGKKASYLYGIAALRRCRGQGIGSRLIRFSIDYLQKRGYEVIALSPAQSSLFPYYERFGFGTVGTIRETFVTAGAPLPIRRLTAAEYAALRKKLLPAHSFVQEGACLELLARYAEFYATENAVAAVADHMILELLGSDADAPGLLGALSLPAATLRTPGGTRPFAMAIGAEAPSYLGLALD